MKFRDIPQFTRSRYDVNWSWWELDRQIERMADSTPVDFDPPYQREHVWTEAQQTAYVEYGLRGGRSGRDIYFNCPSWMGRFNHPFSVVDGKQRLTAVLRFIRDEITAFGLYKREFEGNLDPMEPNFVVHIADLTTDAEVIRWYLDLNFAGTPHTDEERARVQALLEGGDE